MKRIQKALYTGLFAFCFLFMSQALHSHVFAASYSPYDVNMSDFNKKTKADRGNSFESGKKLVYDVYHDDSNTDGWSVVNRNYGKGAQPYLEFKGWSAIVGYHNHYSDNQETYIWLKNRQDGRDKVYKAEQLANDASKDLEYNRMSSTGPINTPCKDSDYNKNNEKCNMYYKSVGFKVHIPLNDLFPKGEESTKWSIYIVKKVENKVLYDEMRLPFEFSDLDFNDGKINLSSGINAKQLRMNTEGVLRRAKPREGGLDNLIYFTQGATYQMKTYDQSGVVIWYGVASPKDGGKTKWAASPYWNFAGEIATISYQSTKKTCPDGSVIDSTQKCSIDITIKHKDSGSGKILRTDHKTLKEGTSYTFVPEKKGVFKDSKGNPYVASPSTQKFTGKASKNITLTFTYAVSKPDPSETHHNGGSGQANGSFLWKLWKPQESTNSVILLQNNMKITGDHYQVRNIKYGISVNNVFSQSSSSPLNLQIDADSIKGKTINYSFEYEYTDYSQDNYKCVKQQGKDCLKWQYVNTTPVWEKGETEKWQTTLVADHHRGETIFADEGNSVQQLLVGQDANFNGSPDSISKNDYYETFILPISTTNLISQGWFYFVQNPIQYQVDIPNETWHAIPKVMSYFPVDLDPNLKSKYQNTTGYDYSEYAIPLRIDSVNKAGSSEWNINVISKDDFYLTKNTGMTFSVPHGSSIDTVNQAAKSEYERFTKSTYSDSVLTDGNNHSKYYIPVDVNSKLQPETVYQNMLVLGQLGLSDITFEFGNNFSFQRYLLGSVFDNPLVNEQHDPTIDIENYPHSIVITDDERQQIQKIDFSSFLLHGFRITDGQRIFESIKKILTNLDI